MNKDEWIKQATHDADPIRDLLRSYHPAQRRDLYQKPRPVIAAPAAEYGCELVRRKIAKESGQMDPVAEFDKALAAGDVGTINNLLNAAWFGVPESTECWRLSGFSEAVALMDDLPEEEEGEQHPN